MDLRRLRDAAIVGFGIAFILLILQILVGNPFEALDRPMHDALERTSLRPNEEIVLVDLDEASVGALGERVDWPAIWLPQVLEQMSAAKAIGVTLPFFRGYSFPLEAQGILRWAKTDSLSRWFRLPAGRTEEILDSLFAYAQWDEALISTIRSNNNVYFGFKMLDEHYSEDVLSFSIRIPNRSKDSIRVNTAILESQDFLAPPYRWRIASNGLGYLDVIYDKDGVVRKVPLIALCKGNFYPSIALTLLQAVEGREDIDIPRSRVLQLGAEEFKLAEGYAYRIHYTSGLTNFTRVSVLSLLAGEVPLDTFKDKVVIVGSSFEPYAMSSATPIDGALPRMVLVANLLTGLMQRRQASPPSIVITFILTFFLAGVGAFSVMLPWRKFILPAFVGLFAIFYIIVAASAANGIRIAFFTPLFASVLAIASGFVIYHYAEGRRRTYIKQMVGQYFPESQKKEYFERFMDLPYMRINRESVVMAVYLEFEKLAKSLQEALKSFEEFRSRILEIVRKQEGIRMTFTGGCNLFLFTGKECYSKACHASLEIRRFFTNFNAKYVTEGIGEFTMGIGLASGETFVSTLGKVPLVDLAAFGKPLIWARQLALMNFEQKTKMILIEEGIFNHLPSQSKARELGELEIVGEKHEVYEYLR
jgi:adenylate cyclase